MASVCKWLSFYLCLRDAPKLSAPDHFAPSLKTSKAECNMYDAIIVWKEGPKEKQGGMAYDVILAPSKGNTPKKATTSPKERPLSQEIIQKKLKEAEERRQSVELAKLQAIAKQKERALEAVKKVEELNDSFAKETEKKLEKKIKTNEEKRQEQLDALQGRLKEHMRRVEEVRKNVVDQCNDELRERIENKIKNMQNNRQSQILQVQERLREHERHIKDVIESSNKMSEEMSKVTEEKMVRKMNVTLKNREDQLSSLVEKMKLHEKHVQEVREKAKNTSPTDETAAPIS